MSDHSEPFHPNLTAREVDVLRLVAGGLSSQQTADQLGLSKRTVDDHLSKVYSKLGVGNRVQALHAAVRIGIVTHESMKALRSDDPRSPQD